MTGIRCDEFDIHEAGFVRDPYPAYQGLRASCPVAHGSRHGGYWLLTRYGDVREAARDWRSFTSAVVGVTAIPVITPRTKPQLPIELDPPEHSSYRAILNPLFSPARVEQFRSRIETIARSLLDAARADSAPDLVTGYAEPLSVATLAEFSGLPSDDADRWLGWIRRMFDVRSPEQGAAASAEFGAYIDDLIRTRRRAPTDDFISVLIGAEIDGRALSDEEVHSFCRDGVRSRLRDDRRRDQRESASPGDPSR